jgi:hypothetical protein
MTMKLYHATTRQRFASIQAQGLLVAKADPAARIKGCWLATASNRPWGVLHTIKKHRAQLEEIVVIEVHVPRRLLTRFRTGLWYTTQDVPAAWLGAVTDGGAFGASASE